MPKRTKTPPPSEDEPRYLVVVHPYPLNANLLLHADRRTLALWLACCTGKDALYAMYYKPASPGMVIIEVDRYFEGFDSLLGKHVWPSFLKYPTEEDVDKASKVFWCHYNTGRLVQKNGWKRVDVEEHWFQGWSPNNDIIKHPYPKTAYCDVPAEAQTGVPLCRPLPKDTFTPPPPRPRPTVGSAEWIHSRSSKISSEAPSSSRRRRGNHGSQIAPSDSASMVSSPIANSGIGARAPPPQRAHISQWIANQRANEPVWPQAPSTISSSFTLSFSTASSSVGSRTPSALGAAPAVAPPPSRPSVPSIGPYESLDWSEELEIQQDDVPTSPQSGASTSRAPGGRTAPPRRAPEPGAIDPDQDYEYEEEDIPKRSTADAMKDLFDGAPGVAASVGNHVGLHDLEEEEEEEEDEYLAWNYPQAVRTTTRDWTPAGAEDEGDVEDPWDGYGAARWEGPTKVNIKGGEKWICPEHGPTCNPGVCKARGRVEAERRWAKEHEERLEEKSKREEKWKKAAEKRERKLAQAEGREVSHDLPPHFASHRYRGAGGSGSDSASEDSQSSDSPAGSESHPPPFSPQEDAEDAGGWAEEGSLWDDAPPKVSLPSNRSVTGSNRVEGEDEARSVGHSRTASSTTNPNSNSSNNNPATRQESTWVARSAAASERPQLARPGDTRGAASVRPAAASSWGDGPRATTQSPPGLRQSVRGTRGTASLPTSTTSSRGTSSQRPAPGRSQSVSNTRSTASAWTTTTSTRNGSDADAAPAPWPRQGNGRQRDRGRSGSTGASSPTLSDHRSTGGPGAIATSQSSSVSSEPRSPASLSRVPTSPPGIFHPVDGGFPSFADTTWGDPIAAAQSASTRKSGKSSTNSTSATSSCSAVGADIAGGQAGGDNGRGNVEAEQEQNTAGQNDRTGRGRRGNRRGGRRGTARRTAIAPAAAPSASQDVARPNALDVTLPPAGPGEHWSKENVEW